MYHHENSVQYKGEKYTIHVAEEVLEKYKELLDKDIQVCDIYIAINAQYHDYISLFKMWKLDNLDCKIIEAALIFWFCDEDYIGHSKLSHYFNK